MKILIVGAGEVGFNLAKMLSAENYDIIIMDSNPDKCQRAREHLDTLVFEGDGGSVKALSNAGINKVDMLIAATSVDEVNIMACMFANRLGVKKRIARVRNSEYSQPRALITPLQLGIDKMIHPEEEAAQQISRLVRRSGASEVAEFADGRVQVVGIRLQGDSPILNMRLNEVGTKYPDLKYRTVAIARNGKTIVPGGEDKFVAGDHIYVISRTEIISEVMNIAGMEQEPIRNAMILGASKIGRRIAQLLEERISVKIIDRNHTKSERAAKMLKNSLIIKGDGTDIEFLQGEGIKDTDAFIATTQSEETNIISCVLAKHLGARKVIVHVGRNDLIPVVDKIGIDAVVSKSLATVDAILKYARRGEIVRVATLEGTDVEAIELVPQQGSKITKSPLKKCKLPKNTVIGAQIHVDNVTIPTGEDTILPGDKVVIFTKTETVPDIENLFSKKLS